MYAVKEQNNQVDIGCAIVIARSKAEAIGFLIEEANKRWPMKNGWNNHQSMALIIDDASRQSLQMVREKDAQETRVI
jgi:hypothetical protein